MSGKVDDQRTRDLDKPDLWACAKDGFLSGWGYAPRGSYVAYPVYSDSDRIALLAWMDNRSDYIQVHVNVHLPRVKEGQHLSIYDRPLHVIQKHGETPCQDV